MSAGSMLDFAVTSVVVVVLLVLVLVSVVLLPEGCGGSGLWAGDGGC